MAAAGTVDASSKRISPSSRPRPKQLVAEETGLRSLTGPARPGDRPPGLGERERRLLPAVAAPSDAEAGGGDVEAGADVGPGRRCEYRRRSAATSAGRSSACCWAGCPRGSWASTTSSSIEDERPEDQDIVYYVGHNVIELEDRYGFQPRQFRLWIALHEVTHRAQFTGVPWLRPHFLRSGQRRCWKGSTPTQSGSSKL